MANDPNATTSSTSPAPAGSDSTSKEGNTIPLLVAKGGNTPPAPDAPMPDMIKTIDGTITFAKKGGKGVGGERKRRHGKDDAVICA